MKNRMKILDTIFGVDVRMKNWMKILAVVLLIYVHLGGLLFNTPRLEILNETIRAVYFHVPMWFGMIFLYTFSAYFAVAYLRNPSEENDRRSVAFVVVGIVFGLLGWVTGMIWARYTWDFKWEYYKDWKNLDPKQLYAAICLLIYMAYFVLRASVANGEQKARLSAVYNIFAFAAMIPLIFILPRLHSSLHPGNGGNPGFNSYDLDNRMRMVFYPAIIAWILVGAWMATQRKRLMTLKAEVEEMHMNSL